MLVDPRVSIITADGRFFLAHPTDETPYDAILVNLPDPSTVLINRFYSREFFAAAKARLRAGGLLMTRLSFSPDYLGPELEDLAASVYRTDARCLP